MKIKEVIEIVLGYHPMFPKEYKGADDFKCGNPEDECTGVVVALVPTVNVIKKAIELNANLILCHEPTYHTSSDDGWHEAFNNSVVEEKMKLVEDHGIVIWRDHDHMHAHQPDQIFTGVLKYLGFDQQFYKNSNTGAFAHYICDIEETTLECLCVYLCDKIGLNGCRYIGDPDLAVKRIAFLGHLYPEKREVEYSVNCIREFEEHDVDVVIPLETIDWTICSYVRDGYQLNKPMGLISAGHFNIEELGMKYLCEQLKPLVSGVCMTYVESEDIYYYYKKG
ncbi:MAG: Nif3-like dinuclear metal center hexameric protein [Erysipelotrichaceae bacterium]|nr:Nif3-like dinuclear metal center hexameric protein [Erysipelotrichaceae bacterium]